jgi:hypothetical protein
MIVAATVAHYWPRFAPLFGIIAAILFSQSARMLSTFQPMRIRQAHLSGEFPEALYSLACGFIFEIEA